MSKKKDIQNIVDRMRCLFYATTQPYASREIVEKWADEIEAILNATAEALVRARRGINR